MAEPEESQDDATEATQFAIQFALDDDAFFRRECSSCGLDFKVKIDPEDYGDLLAPTFRQIEQEYGKTLSVAGESSTDETRLLCCPYCGSKDKSENMLTGEFSDYVRRWAYREVAYPLIQEFLEDISGQFERRSLSSGKSFISIQVSSDNDAEPPPIRPISGPELPDMAQIELLCCHKSIKILEGWLSAIYCPYCSQHLVLQ